MPPLLLLLLLLPQLALAAYGKSVLESEASAGDGTAPTTLPAAAATHPQTARPTSAARPRASVPPPRHHCSLLSAFRSSSCW